MSFETGAGSLDVGQANLVYLKRRAREEADAAARAGSMAATLIHGALATAYAKRCCAADGQSWVAENRLW